MTLADLPVLNPSTPGREARRAAVVAALFAVFGALYALARAAEAAPPDLSASTDPVFGFAFPRGWGIALSSWTGAATWPARLAAGDLGGTMAVLAVVILAIALVIIMHPDILSRQGPQYVSPARRITTVAIAFVMAFLIYFSVGRIDTILTSRDATDAGKQLVGFAALSLLLFGGVWSFIGPKDFGRRVPLRISHGALGGVAVWGAVCFATMLSSQPRAFLSGSLDTYFTLLTIDAAAGKAGATAGWAMSSDVLTAAVAMAFAGALLVVTAPQSLGPGNRRSSALLAAIIGAFLGVVALTTWSVTKTRAAAVNYDVTTDLQLETQAPARAVVLLSGATASGQNAERIPVVPTATADDCMGGTTAEERALPAATAGNIQKLTAWIDSHGGEVSGQSIRVANCRAALQTLRWDVDHARQGIFITQHPERILFMSYFLAAPNVSSAPPGLLRRILEAMSDTARYQHGAEAAQRFAALARISGDTALEASWRQRIIQPTPEGAIATLLARPQYIDGTISGRLQTPRPGWKVGLVTAPDPTSGAESVSSPRAEGPILSGIIASTDVGADGRFSFTGLRDGYYALALLSPEGTAAQQLSGMVARGAPGTFQLEPNRKNRDVGTITLTY